MTWFKYFAMALYVGDKDYVRLFISCRN